MGCDACGQTGYSGRVGLYEIQRLSPRLKDLVTKHATERVLRRAASSAGVRFLLDDGLAKVRQGLTTVEEIPRVIRIEHAEDLPAASGRGRSPAGSRNRLTRHNAHAVGASSPDPMQLRM
jgi:hypothetical protein